MNNNGELAGKQASELAEVILTFPGSTLHVCPGCQEATLEAGAYCRECRRLQAELEERYREAKAKGQRANSVFGAQERVDCGMVARRTFSINWERQLVCAGIAAFVLLCWSGIAKLVWFGLHCAFPHSF
jgi:hypothetical protein